jgi:RNA polymerase sigma-70 factor (ECF subfamily)
VFQTWREGGFGTERFGQIRCIATRANLQPAIAAYVCVPGDTAFRALTIEVLRIEGGLVREIVLFLPDYFPLFGLPMVLDEPRQQRREADQAGQVVLPG